MRIRFHHGRKSFDHDGPGSQAATGGRNRSRGLGAAGSRNPSAGVNQKEYWSRRWVSPKLLSNKEVSRCGSVDFYLDSSPGLRKKLRPKGRQCERTFARDRFGTRRLQNLFKVFASGDHIPIIGKGALLRTNASLKTRNDVCFKRGKLMKPLLLLAGLANLAFATSTRFALSQASLSFAQLNGSVVDTGGR